MKATVGRCGARTGATFPGQSLAYCCELPAGHAGWHRDGTCEWTEHPGTPTRTEPTSGQPRHNTSARPWIGLILIGIAVAMLDQGWPHWAIPLGFGTGLLFAMARRAR